MRNVSVRKWLLPDRYTLFVCLFVLATAYFGIATRPVGLLATIWPANAILLGLYIRFPRLVSLPSFVAAFVGFMVADVTTGNTFDNAFWLTVANLSGVVVGVYLFQRRSLANRELRRPRSMLILCLNVVLASTAAALGSAPVVAAIMGESLPLSLTYWFASEIDNYTVILPVVLTFPAINLRQSWRTSIQVDITQLVRMAAPVAALIGIIAISVVIGGPGAMVFPIPVMIWCALTYSFFTTSVITMFWSTFTIYAISSGLMDIRIDGDYGHGLLSIRLGVALMSLAPLTVASMAAAHARLVTELDIAASHDALTGSLTRGSFMRRGQAMLESLVTTNTPLAALMMDIDHFKGINDRYGHAAGDLALVQVVRLLKQILPETALLGRLGGEEFAVLIPNLRYGESLKLANQLRSSINQERLVLNDDVSFGISMSVGLMSTNAGAETTLHSMLTAADEALYQAKTLGRDQVQVRI